MGGGERKAGPWARDCITNLRGQREAIDQAMCAFFPFLREPFRGVGAAWAASQRLQLEGGSELDAAVTMGMSEGIKGGREASAVAIPGTAARGSRCS